MIRLLPARTNLLRQTSEPHTIAVATGTSVCLVKVKRNRRARRYTLRVLASSHEAVVTMPWRGNLADAKDFVQAHAAWLDARLAKLPDAQPFVDGEMLPLRGVPHRILHRPGSRGTVWPETAVDGEPLLCVAGDVAHLSRRIHDFLKREARRDLASSARRYADLLGVKIARMTVRDQSSRWGSCNSAGVLSFSWRLILAPPDVLDYLAAHEVAHLVEMNHGPRFWRLVMSVCPTTKSAKSWLDVHGNDLHRYGMTD